MKNHSLLNFIIFTFSLVIGYSFSTRFYQSDFGILPSTMRLVASDNQNSIETMKNGQRSILLISAASIKPSNPKLESIWLATYFSSDTTIRLLPIFPTGNQSISDFERQVEQSFDLNKKNDKLVLDQEFINVLENNNYWWSGYVIFDEVALTKIFNLMGGIDLNGKTLSGEQALDELSKMVDSPQEALSAQIAILQSVCHNFFEISPNLDKSQIISLFPNHIFTDLDSTQLQSEMQSLYSSEHNPTCKFPMLEISRIEH